MRRNFRKLKIPFLFLISSPPSKYILVFKRMTDVILSLVLIVITSPLMLISAILVKTTSPGPAIFAQKRVGSNGNIFTMYKFRSMIKDAEDKLKTIKNENYMQGPVFKMRSDPRITPIGRILRKTSIDELPQLFNVLKGDMSLVGPRPPLPYEVDKYEPWQLKRLSIKPGLTCLWQISGRNNITDFDHWVKLDLEYIANWSFGLDVAILLKTVMVVIGGAGAE